MHDRDWMQGNSPTCGFLVVWAIFALLGVSTLGLVIWALIEAILWLRSN